MSLQGRGKSGARVEIAPSILRFWPNCHRYTNRSFWLTINKRFFAPSILNPYFAPVLVMVEVFLVWFSFAIRLQFLVYSIWIVRTFSVLCYQNDYQITVRNDTQLNPVVFENKISTGSVKLYKELTIFDVKLTKSIMNFQNIAQHARM